jgi:hypothetical protein
MFLLTSFVWSMAFGLSRLVGYRKLVLAAHECEGFARRVSECHVAALQTRIKGLSVSETDARRTLAA